MSEIEKAMKNKLFLIVSNCPNIGSTTTKPAEPLFIIKLFIYLFFRLFSLANGNFCFFFLLIICIICPICKKKCYELPLSNCTCPQHTHTHTIFYYPQKVK